MAALEPIAISESNVGRTVKQRLKAHPVVFEN